MCVISVQGYQAQFLVCTTALSKCHGYHGRTFHFQVENYLILNDKSSLGSKLCLYSCMFLILTLTLGNKGSCWILLDVYCSVTMLRELGLIHDPSPHATRRTPQEGAIST